MKCVLVGLLRSRQLPVHERAIIFNDQQNEISENCLGCTSFA